MPRTAPSDQEAGPQLLDQGSLDGGRSRRTRCRGQCPRSPRDTEQEPPHDCHAPNIPGRTPMVVIGPALAAEAEPPRGKASRRLKSKRHTRADYRLARARCSRTGRRPRAVPKPRRQNALRAWIRRARLQRVPRIGDDGAATRFDDRKAYCEAPARSGGPAVILIAPSSPYPPSSQQPS
jgi:hypothetical protein